LSYLYTVEKKKPTIKQHQKHINMKTIFHPAEQRGHAQHGWLDSHHSFSFASFYNPSKMGFGVLRVLNDDRVAPRMGFSAHPHDNMEIISIPLSGALAHKDNMGNEHTISTGEIQVMSAGTGIVHSEMNKSGDEETKFLQIWVHPNKRNVEPRYDQRPIATAPNTFHQILSPEPKDPGVWIHQDAWFSLGNFDSDQTGTYSLNKKGNGTYVFVLEGEFTIGEKTLGKRDAMGIHEADYWDWKAPKGAKVLIMEIPMNA
jgi:redox-sensitive bicupin YhaK (pirin superfamily)